MSKEVKKFSSALSLQDQCLVYLIPNISRYASSELTALPKMLRHELLINLPVVDICHLEGTSFVDGLAMDTIWEEIRVNHLYTNAIHNGRLHLL